MKSRGWLTMARREIRIESCGRGSLIYFSRLRGFHAQLETAENHNHAPGQRSCFGEEVQDSVNGG